MDDPHFKSLLQALRPGVRVAGSRNIATTILEKVYAEERKALATKLGGELVTLSCDGWTTSMTVPTVGLTLDDDLFELQETGDTPHTGDFLGAMVECGVAQASSELGAEVAGVVTDSASNMVAMRTYLKTKLPGVIGL